MLQFITMHVHKYSHPYLISYTCINKGTSRFIQVISLPLILSTPPSQKWFHPHPHGRQLSGAWEVDGVVSGWLGCARPEVAEHG